MDGAYFLIDSGTYAYHSYPQWRSYFRGTSAHNTVRVDGQDQSVAAGTFQWTQKAHARLLSFRSGHCIDNILAEHDGYRRLADPVTHRRSIALDKAAPATQVCMPR